MPYVSGDTLRDRIDREKQLPSKPRANHARRCGRTRVCARPGHDHGTSSRRTFSSPTGHPILADFGIARVIDLAGVRQAHPTGMGSPGTPAYMSPEQLMGDRRLDGRSDTIASAASCSEMLTGKPPFSRQGRIRQAFHRGAPACGQSAQRFPPRSTKRLLARWKRIRNRVSPRRRTSSMRALKSHPREGRRRRRSSRLRLHSIEICRLNQEGLAGCPAFGPCASLSSLARLA